MKNNKKKINMKKKKTLSRSKVQSRPQKRKNKLTLAQYYELSQIEWVPFDSGAD